MGRNKIEIDTSEVERLAGLGLTQDEICTSLGISESTFYKNKRENTVFADAIKKGKSSAAEVVSNKLFGLCKKGNLGAIIWYEKTRRGLSDRIEHSGDPDRPIVLKAEQLTDDDLARIIATIANRSGKRTTEPPTGAPGD